MRFLIVSFLSGVALMAQSPAQPSHLRYQPTYDEVKSALGLTEDEISKLKQMQQERQTATQAFYTKMADKQKELNQLLESSSADAAHVGQLMIDLQQLRKQQPPPVTDIHDKAVALLTSEQKEKLARIEDAQKLRGAVDQALQLGLITPLPAPASAPRAPVAGRMQPMGEPAPAGH